MANLYNWSTTAADNDDADSGINWLEGQRPSTVNNSARTMMARIKAWLADTTQVIATTGSSNAYVASSTQSFASLVDGARVYLLPNHTNTGAATLALDSLTAKPLRSASATALSAGAILVNRPFTATYYATGDEFLIDQYFSDAELDAIANLTPTDGNVIVGDGSTWVAESGATARTSLGLGTGDSPTFTDVTTTGNVELGHATDTTLARSAAGRVTIEGNEVPAPGSQAQGDVLYHDGTTWARLAAGTAAYALTMNSGATAPEWTVAGGLIAVQTFTSSGTYTATSGARYVHVEIVGGGGGGGDPTAGGTSTDAAGSAGGGAGGYCAKQIAAATATGATVTIGAAGASGSAGGNSSWSDGTNTLTANGGAAGANGANDYWGTGDGGAGGSASGGDVNIAGGDGSDSWCVGDQVNTTVHIGAGGAGASSKWGTGGLPEILRGTSAAGLTGNAATGYGAGGSGGGCVHGSTGGSGGAGTAGICIVYEYA